MAIALVQEASFANGGAASTDTPVTQAGSATAGNVLVACCIYFTAQSISSVFDSQGNAYTQRGSDLVVGNHKIRVLTAIASASNIITLTMRQGASNNQGLSCLREISGQAASPFDNVVQATQASPGTGTDILSSGNLTPSAQPGLLSVFGWDETTTVAGTAGTGATIVQAGLSGGNMGGQFFSAYKPVSSLSPVAGTFTLASGGTNTYGTIALLLDQLVAAARGGLLTLGVG